MAKDFLLEIGVEPFPARFLKPGIDQLSVKIKTALEENRLSFDLVERYATPRRLAVIVKGLAEKSTPETKTFLGPPAGKIKDGQGDWSREAVGFAAKHGLGPQDLKFTQTPKGQFLAAEIKSAGEDTAVILARILPEIISSLEFQKSMEWESSRMRFARPIRHVAAILGKKVVSFKIAGLRSGRKIGALFSDNTSPVLLPEAGAYGRTLGVLLVQANVEDRRRSLIKKLEQISRHMGASVEMDEDLIEETVCMTEHPNPVQGKFNDEFLSLPEPLLSSVLKKQLKFFPAREKSGRLSAAFIGVRDGASEGQQLIREGYQRVLAARLSDASFFFSRDLKSSLESKLPLLEKLGYQKDLGNMAQKSKRVGEISAKLCSDMGADRPLNESAVQRIAQLCYADLVCETVREFPELQGIMGGVFARREGMDERVAMGLDQFYFPVAARGPIPSMDEGALVSFAGKIDSLAGCFAVGLEPTGKADPYALRRQALGALRIAIEKQFSFDVEAAVSFAVALQPALKEEIADKIIAFLWVRAESFFQEMGYAPDEIRSVRRGALNNMPRAALRLAAVHSIRKHPDFEPLSQAFKRASNILKQAGWDGTHHDESADLKILTEPAEIDFLKMLENIGGAARRDFSTQNYEAGLKTLVAIKPALDAFFDKTMIMAENKDIRDARLSLLSRLVRLFHEVSDLSEIQPSAKT
ncbi:MAG: glycine--tRNA ligase subunit beta [Elusimicrobiota bacterium]